MSNFKNNLDYAIHLDDKDPLQDFRNQFHLPVINGKEVVYFTGNSLGLQPRTAKTIINQELEDWKNWGVEGHFHAKNPWYSYHEIFAKGASKIVGAQENEVVMMNGLTVNLHLLLLSFYRPTKERFKIICEAKAFPSDQYALESQVRQHGLNPEDTIIEIHPREGEHCINHEDIYSAIEENKDQLALIMIGGVNYYTGQVFDMKAITEAGHKAGAYVGFDLAHAAGNIELKLHDWKVDFACWCTYKYLNSGPGSIAGAFVNEKHATDPEFPRLAGWWGYDKSTRFEMKSGFKAIPTAEGWQLSNAPVFSMAAHKAALDIHNRAGIDRLTQKSKKLTGYLEFIIQDVASKVANVEFEVITPQEEAQRGAQLSIHIHGKGKEVFDYLMKEGVIVDWREPNVIRMAPVPLYNSYSDVYEFGQILKKALK